MIRINFDMMMNPEAHGLVQCLNCGGYGSSLRESSHKCSVCNGVGLVRRVTNNALEATCRTKKIQ